VARRKKKYMLLQGKFGTFIVVEREWYDHVGFRKRRLWKIVRESDDNGMLCAMAGLTDRFVKLDVRVISDY
jgi:hypothetical protein